MKLIVFVNCFLWLILTTLARYFSAYFSSPTKFPSAQYERECETKHNINILYIWWIFLTSLGHHTPHSQSYSNLHQHLSLPPTKLLAFMRQCILQNQMFTIILRRHVLRALPNSDITPTHNCTHIVFIVRTQTPEEWLSSYEIPMLHWFTASVATRNNSLDIVLIN